MDQGGHTKWQSLRRRLREELFPPASSSGLTCAALASSSKPAFTLIPGRLSKHGSIRIAPLRHLCPGLRLFCRAVAAKSSSHAQLYIPKPANERTAKLTLPLFSHSFLAEPGGKNLGERRGEISWGGKKKKIGSGGSCGKKGCLSLRSPCTMSNQILYVLQKPSSTAAPSLIMFKELPVTLTKGR